MVDDVLEAARLVREHDGNAALVALKRHGTLANAIEGIDPGFFRSGRIHGNDLSHVISRLLCISGAVPSTIAADALADVVVFGTTGQFGVDILRTISFASVAAAEPRIVRAAETIIRAKKPERAHLENLKLVILQELERRLVQHAG